MKTLRTAAMVVGAVALIATGVGAGIALAQGITVGAAMGTAVTAGVTLGSIATVASVASAGLSIAAAAAYKRPPLTGSPTTFNPDPQAGIPYMMGRAHRAGRVAFIGIGS
nr:hypothetical protein [Sphingomonas sp. Y57]